MECIFYHNKKREKGGRRKGGREGGREGGRKEGRKAGRKEGKARLRHPGEEWKYELGGSEEASSDIA